MDPLLRDLEDRRALGDQVHRYARAVDSRDWSALRAVFMPEIEADFRSFAGREVFRGSADDWVATIRATVGGMDATQHAMSNLMFDIDGDRAQVHADLIAAHVLAQVRGEREYTVGGYYDWRFERTDGGWRCSRYVLTVSWDRGNREVLRAASRNAAAG